VAPSPAKEAARLGWREPWYDKQGRIDQRGRVGVEGEVDVSRLPGIIPLEDKVFGLWALRRAGISNWGMGTYGANDMNFHDKKHKRMFRRRGVDMFKVTDFLEPNYKAKLKKHGLDFSASASGTTSTLIAAAQSFAPEIVQNSGLLKEYVMACTAYLVGGGMHTCHEVFYTASLSGFLNYSLTSKAKGRGARYFKHAVNTTRTIHVISFGSISKLAPAPLATRSLPSHLYTFN